MGGAVPTQAKGGLKWATRLNSADVGSGLDPTFAESGQIWATLKIVSHQATAG